MAGEVTEECPFACIGFEETSMLLIFPRRTPWKVAVAPTRNRLMLAVKGFWSTKEVEATPVLTISIGNVREALLIRVWCNAGIVTGDNRISDSALFRDSIGVES
jgi:hypothetical protein